jgi:hypothetical protein
MLAMDFDTEGCEIASRGPGFDALKIYRLLLKNNRPLHSISGIRLPIPLGLQAKRHSCEQQNPG